MALGGRQTEAHRPVRSPLGVGSISPFLSGSGGVSVPSSGRKASWTRCLAAFARETVPRGLQSRGQNTDSPQLRGGSPGGGGRGCVGSRFREGGQGAGGGPSAQGGPGTPSASGSLQGPGSLLIFHAGRQERNALYPLRQTRTLICLELDTACQPRMDPEGGAGEGAGRRRGRRPSLSPAPGLRQTLPIFTLLRLPKGGQGGSHREREEGGKSRFLAGS